LYGGEADPQLAAVVLGGPVDGFGGDLGLIDRRHGLRVARELGATPLELGGVDAGQLDHRDLCVAVVGEQFGADGIGEAADGELRAATGGLEGMAR